mgnify:CR=1 FL=1
MSTNDPIVIVSAARTPMGGFQGDFANLTAPQLGSAAIKAAVERAGLSPEAVEEVIFGCVLPAGLGQAPARQAALGAGLPLSAGCTTVMLGKERTIPISSVPWWVTPSPPTWRPPWLAITLTLRLG